VCRHKEHGWPGDLHWVELFQQTVHIRRQSTRVRDPFRVEHG
jgi:hypothetical protein